MTGDEPHRIDRPGMRPEDRSARRHADSWRPEPPRSDRRRVAADGAPSRGLFRTIPHPIVRYEIEGDERAVRAVNPAFERTFDVDESAVADDPLVDHLLTGAVEIEPEATSIATDDAADSDARGDPNGEATAETILSRLVDGERVVIGVPQGDGETRHFRVELVPPAEGGTEAYVVYTEVTEFRRQAGRLGAKAERLERVVSVAAHDLRNPLEVAKIRLEAARDTGEEVHFRKVEGALDRIQRIVQDALSVGGGEVDPSDRVALDGVAEAAWSTVETADASLVLEDDLPVVEADADSLQQVFENLFRNAIEHGRRDATVTVGNLSDGFYVADDGPGIPASERDRAFEPGYSTEDDNTGLGLAIVRQIAEDHGWRVSLESGETGGARFEFVWVEDHRSA